MWTEACETLASKLCAPCVRASILFQVGFPSSLIERLMDAVAMSALARGDYNHEGTAVGILDRYGTGRKTAMHGTEQRMLATGALAEFDHGHADTIAEIGCLTRVAPRAWWDEREGAGEVSASRLATNPRHAAGTGCRAVEHYSGHDKGPERVTGALGCPKSRERLCELVGECLRMDGEGTGSGFRERWSPRGESATVIGPGARTATLVAPPWE